MFPVFLDLGRSGILNGPEDRGSAGIKVLRKELTAGIGLQLTVQTNSGNQRTSTFSVKFLGGEETTNYCTVVWTRKVARPVLPITNSRDD